MEDTMPIPKVNKQEAPKSAKVRIYEALKEWIVDGTLKPGEKILDSEISAYFSVSRTPVREAMQLLADQKLIEIYPGRESRVSEIGNVNLWETYRVLAGLHCLALEFAYPKITDEVIRRLEATNNRFAEICKKNDYKTSLRLDREFHDIFIQLAGNDFINDFTRTLDCHVERAENLYFNELDLREESVRQHKQIIAHLRSHDLEQAKQVMYNNWMHTVESLHISTPN